MNIFSRLFKIGQAEAHDTINHLEDPIKMTEQGIRDMKLEMDKALQALAEVKALSIRTKSELNTYQDRGRDYEHKAIMLLKKSQSGDMDATDADRLATQALQQKEQAEQNASRLQEERQKYEGSVQQLEKNIDTLKSNINTWDNELRTLKARMRVSTATKTMNKQLANIDTSSTVSMLERMKDKVAQEEAIAQSYGEIAQEARTVDDEINKALDSGKDSDASQKLLELKKRLGMPQTGISQGESSQEESSQGDTPQLNQ